MSLPIESLVLLVVPPAAIFALALVHWLRAPGEGQGASDERRGEDRAA